ncbi:MAG: hypothetical protein KAV87_31930 [Desulfobacteraceae bacterium]|nr:hypothetical protein [Desulfobacteraceae bacterium]
MTFPSQLWAMTPMSMGYINKVLKPNSSIGYDPSSLVGFWPQNEKSGLVSIDHSGLGHHGAYQGVDLGRAGVPGMGMTSPFYDGVNDFNNIYGAGLANDNLLLNPGFETPGGGGADIWAGWTETAGDGALANEVVIVHEGVDACKMTSGPTVNTRVQENFAVLPNMHYRMRIWTQGDGVNAGRFRIRDETNGVDITAGTISTGITGAAYGMVPYLFTTPAGCVLVSIRLQCPPVNGGVCYFDATEVRRMNGFLGDQGTILAWAQVANAGAWTDITIRCAVRIGGVADYVIIRKSNVNNRLDWGYAAGGVGNWFNEPAINPINFMLLGITWDISAGATGQVLAFRNGLQTGATAVNLGTWNNNLTGTSCVIGANSTVPVNVWSGNIGPDLLFNEAKTPAEMLYLSTP